MGVEHIQSGLLTKVEIVNFRGIKELSLQLDSTTILIGENNTGKSSILRALQSCLSSSVPKQDQFSEYDYHLTSDSDYPPDSAFIEITLHLDEQRDFKWPESITTAFRDVIQVDENDGKHIILRVRSQYDSTAQRFKTGYNFLSLDKEELQTTPRRKQLELLPVFYLTALRSTESFKPNARFWRPFVDYLEIDPAARKVLEDALVSVNQKITDSHGSFGIIKEYLDYIIRNIPLNSTGPASIESVPTKIIDVLARAQVVLKSATGAGMPIAQHGEGTQSLAVLCLLYAFLKGKLNKTTPNALPILTLEEPEAHLHPSAIR